MYIGRGMNSQYTTSEQVPDPFNMLTDIINWNGMAAIRPKFYTFVGLVINE